MHEQEVNRVIQLEVRMHNFLDDGATSLLNKQILKLSADDSGFFNNKTLLKNLIGDIFSHDASLCAILRIAIDEGNAASKLHLLLSLDESRQIVGISQIVSHLSNEIGIEDVRVAEAVRIIGIGIGLPYSLFTPQKDSLIRFGKHKWRVLDEQEGSILILSERILEKRCFHDVDEAVAWANSSLRKYLNSEFYNLFNRDEKARIKEVKIKKLRNPWFSKYGISIDAKDTSDKIFLLGIEDVVMYFGDSGQLAKGNPDSVDDLISRLGNDVNPNFIQMLLAEKSNKGIWIKDCFNKSRIAYDECNEATWWWLRSPGYFPSFTATVNHDGNIYLVGQDVNAEIAKSVGVRPALWLKY